VAEAVRRVSGGRDVLAAMIREYFLVCDRMSDHILLVYQETKALPPEWRNRLLQNEVKLTNIFLRTLNSLVEAEDLPPVPKKSLELLAHNITVLGHMWTFRRWFLSRRYSIHDYIRRQTEFILGKFGASGPAAAQTAKEKP